MKKIMFNDKYGLTQAVLEGRKTQTRRIVTKQQLGTILHFPKHANRNFDELIEGCKSNEYGVKLFSPYAKGEEVAIAQSYRDANVTSETVTLNGITETFCLGDWMHGWNNKMFVCAYLMPHRIRMTNVRVERLQDISKEDCLKEGIYKVDFAFEDRGLYSFRYENEWYEQYQTAHEAFAALIDKVSGKGTWDSNPYVYVYDFELIK